MNSRRATGRRSRLMFREHIDGWIFALPWLLGFAIWTLGPMIASLIFAFTDYDMVTPPRWIGMGNLRELIRDPLIVHSLKVTTLYAVASVPLNICLGLILAMLLNSKIRGLRWYRTGYYLPSVLSGVAAALLWRWIFSPDFGLFNLVLSWFGIKGPAWLADERWALPALVIMSLWGVGGGMIIYLAGLQGIPTELYEAAEVDGAGLLAKTFHVTIPMMSPVIFYQLVMGVIGSLQVFTQGYIITAGGPHNATLFYMLHLYRNAFEYFRMGYASVMAWVLFFYILILTLFVFKSSAAWVYYEGQLRGGR
ncbi:MAG TPA: sugar ABC transporter permease [Firmicutes bacterium]|nr:sugar ABC transporter permease [Bacillota bacterium]HHY98227.1 sugar ABC transporter permease [Bacillota bacterium]